MKERGIIFKWGLIGLTIVLILTSLYLIFLFVPTEESMGVVQRIFYFHVPVAWVAFLAFFIVFVCSIMYLRKRDRKWDIIACSSAEIGVVFTIIVLITGSIWAKPIWGVWWAWEPRLTTALVMCLVYVAYLIVRTFAAEQSRGARFAAIVGIVGFVDVPLVALAITLWRTQHPGPVVFSGGLAPTMLLTLIVCIVAFSALYALLMLSSVSVKNSQQEIANLKMILN